MHAWRFLLPEAGAFWCEIRDTQILLGGRIFGFLMGFLELFVID
jgi:hypothetical protein